MSMNTFRFVSLIQEYNDAYGTEYRKFTIKFKKKRKKIYEARLCGGGTEILI